MFPNHSGYSASAAEILFHAIREIELNDDCDFVLESLEAIDGRVCLALRCSIIAFVGGYANAKGVKSPALQDAGSPLSFAMAAATAAKKKGQLSAGGQDSGSPDDWVAPEDTSRSPDRPGKGKGTREDSQRVQMQISEKGCRNECLPCLQLYTTTLLIADTGAALSEWIGKVDDGCFLVNLRFTSPRLRDWALDAVLSANPSVIVLDSGSA